MAFGTVSRRLFFLAAGVMRAGSSGNALATATGLDLDPSSATANFTRHALTGHPRAVCLDGSPAAYFLKPGADKAKFLIFRESEPPLPHTHTHNTHCRTRTVALSHTRTHAHTSPAP